MQPKVKEALRDIWIAATRDEAYAAFNRALVRFSAKDPKAMEYLGNDRQEMLAFYDSQRNTGRIFGPLT